MNAISAPWIDGRKVAPDQSRVTVVSAMYGSATQSIDVKGILGELPIHLSPSDTPNLRFTDPHYAHPKSLVIVLSDGRTITVEEHYGKWKDPLSIHGNGTVSIIVSCGLANQIYMIIGGAITADRTCRKLSFPFRLLARKTALDVVVTRAKPTGHIDVPFSHLFDEECFRRESGVVLFEGEKRDEHLPPPPEKEEKEKKDEHLPIPSETKEEKKEEEIDERYIEGARHTYTLSSHLRSRYYHESPHVCMQWPITSVILETEEEYNKAIRVLRALRPSPRLAAISSRLIKGCRDRSPDSFFSVVHCRTEADWMVAGRCIIDIGKLVEHIKTHINASRTPNVYIMGGDEAIWARLKRTAPEYNWMIKNEWYDAIPGLSSIGFEEGAVIDREVAIHCDRFLGYRLSTLSLVVVLERDYLGKYYGFYNTPDHERLMSKADLNTFFFTEEGKPFSQYLSQQKTLREIYAGDMKYKVSKWSQYFPLYERYLSPLRASGRKITLLEIGIRHGGSLEMWIKYFGRENLSLFAIDLDPRCKTLETVFGCKIFIGSQSDEKFLGEVMKELPPLDILIDDGGHTMEQHEVSLKMLYPRVKPDGLYIVEDTHTCYWSDYGGGYKNPLSTIEMMKDVIDTLHKPHIRGDVGKIPTPCSIEDSLYSITFVDSLVILEKGKRTADSHYNSERGLIATVST